MNDTVQAAIDAELAKIEPVITHAVAPFGYGSDMSCDSDVDENARELDGFDPLVLAQAIVRRLDCPRGALPDDPGYGIDLRSRINKGMTAEDVRALGGQIRGEVLKDDRVSTLSVVMRPNSTGSLIQVELAVQPIDATIGSFTLTLSATIAEILLSEIRSEL